MKLVLYFFIYFLFFGFYISNLHIGDFETKYLFTSFAISKVESFSTMLFGNNDFAFRFPSLFLSFLSLILYYKISDKFLKPKDLFLSVVIFSLIPGFIIASILVNKSIYLIFMVLLFLYLFLYYRFLSYIVLIIYSLIDYSFIYLYLGLIFYSVYKKDSKFLILNLILFMVNANYFNFKIGGHPRGYFIDLFIVYFSIFSPFVFIYFIYSLMKKIKTPNIIWFISVSSLFLSLLLSFRQRIKIDDFAPFIIPSIVFMIAVFLNDYRIRLKIFRKPYKVLFSFLFLSLITFDILILSSKYFLNKKIVNQFKYSYEIATYLKFKNIDEIMCDNYKLCKKLYFYGLKKGNNYYLFFDKKAKKVSISHNHQKILSFYVSKINKK